MKFVIKLIQAVGGVEHGSQDHVELRPHYVKSYDPDAHGGRGEVDSTPDPNDALTFADQHDAVLYYLQQSTVRPTRLDGKPNRPLTAFTVSIEQLPAPVIVLNARRPQRREA